MSEIEKTPEKEKWRSIDGYEGIYLISNLGRVMAEPRFSIYTDGRVYKIKQRILKNTLGKNGYYAVGLLLKTECKKMYIHRLIAIYFIENPNTYQFVNHINGIKTDNRIENLEWCTCKENVRHAVKTGLMRLGEDLPISKLKNKDIPKIRNLVNSGMSQRKVADMFRVDQGAISCIMRGKTWSHIK